MDEYIELHNNLKEVLSNYTFEELDKLIDESENEVKETYISMKQIKQILLDGELELQRILKELNLEN